MHNFSIQWKALKDKKEDDLPDISKISKALPVMKWTEAFKDFLSRVIGVQMTVPLSYITWELVHHDPAMPALAAGQPHSEIHGSVKILIKGALPEIHFGRELVIITKLPGEVSVIIEI